MKRAASLLLVFLTGCSTAPVADVMDYFWAGQITPDATPPVGGVCIPQGGPPTSGPIPIPVPAAAGPVAPGPITPPPGAIPSPVFPGTNPIPVPPG
jgi:hypothetical protein